MTTGGADLADLDGWIGRWINTGHLIDEDGVPQAR